MRQTPDYNMIQITKTVHLFYYIGAGTVLLANFFYSISLSDSYFKGTNNISLGMFIGVWSTLILAAIFFILVIFDHLSIMKNNLFFWMLFARQVIAFYVYDKDSISDVTNELFVSIKLMLVTVMITIY